MLRDSRFEGFQVFVETDPDDLGAAAILGNQDCKKNSFLR